MVDIDRPAFFRPLLAASRFERQLAEELGGLRAELHREIGNLRSEVHELVGGLRSELHSEIGRPRSEIHSESGAVRAEMRAFEARITRWMFVLWIGQIGALLGILFVFFRP